MSDFGVESVLAVEQVLLVTIPNDMLMVGKLIGWSMGKEWGDRMYCVASMESPSEAVFKIRLPTPQIHKEVEQFLADLLP